MGSTPEDSDQHSDFPSINWEEEEESTRPVPLHEVPVASRRDRELGVIFKFHERIAKAIDTMWGHPECAEYIQLLLISGYKEGEKRMGFRSEVVQALLMLGDIHEQDFPIKEPVDPWKKKSASGAL